ncbi:Imm3 family immunity protein [Paenibacillus macerans]|uniref:Imm3 family immunity protein n=1 Tax=Paenibacillus macerans TaxID=44252 RepID=UPI001B2F4D78|nr:Imm3 family immunity protein [Paenibacillus macerans]MEC0136584.1 Imm3 family immunity protein [Paenibacillus macerans]MEC0333919.1 Imm3 family immunity protein [Paenibacillus macerans]UMV49020.1 immunity protein Imm3 [Paenibacillus macerans]GIP12808.1 hypothetical protein J1TS5_49780 [Paenibacillus macerans]
MSQKLTYEEITDLFDETFQEYKDKNLSNLEALAKTYEDLELIMSKGDLEKATVLIRYCELVLKQPYVFYKSKDYLLQYLNEIDYDSLEQELSSFQYQDLITRKVQVLYNLNNKPVTNNARAMWYYDEMTNEVNRYYSSISSDSETKDAIAKVALDRFKRDCKNTKSEKIVVYTTLAERLLNDGLTESMEYQNIKNTLKEFTVDEVGEQLSNDEKQKLQLRIKRVLNHLSDDIH